MKCKHNNPLGRDACLDCYMEDKIASGQAVIFTMRMEDKNE